jgi:hypothetical protein
MTWKYTGIVAENDAVDGLGPLNSLSATMPRVFRSRTVVFPDRAVEPPLNPLRPLKTP